MPAIKPKIHTMTIIRLTLPRYSPLKAQYGLIHERGEHQYKFFNTVVIWGRLATDLPYLSRQTSINSDILYRFPSDNNPIEQNTAHPEPTFDCGLFRKTPYTKDMHTKSTITSPPCITFENCAAISCPAIVFVKLPM